jgi:hypothetical protein
MICLKLARVLPVQDQTNVNAQPRNVQPKNRLANPMAPDDMCPRLRALNHGKKYMNIIIIIHIIAALSDIVCFPSSVANCQIGGAVSASKCYLR